MENASFRLVLVGLAFTSQAQAQGLLQQEGLMGGGGPPERVECIGEAEWAAAQRSVAEYRLHAPVQRGVPEPFTFYPLGGTLYGDLFTNNFCDLDPSAGILDWDCTDFSYDGHDATDVDLRTFGEQAIGVPVFAALDGTVIGTHDGEDDMHTSCAGVANYVIIDHGNGRVCYYWHLRKNSVQVAPFQVVKAGQQLGLAASSGCSTGPHLHFATYDEGSMVEPYAGPCRAGASAWVDQTPILRTLYARDLNVTNVNIGAYPGLPVDMPRTGTFVQGSRLVRFWVNLHNLPASSTWRVRFRRPNGTIAFSSATVGFGNPFYRWSWWWWSYGMNLNAVGTWHILFDINGSLLASAPFDVVATAGEIVNRPPDPITVELEPALPTADDVLVCRVQTDLVLDDPDYDIVRYRYVWTVDGVVLRDVTSAGQSDAFPRDTAPAGALVVCSVTASDGIDPAPTVEDRVLIQPVRKLRVFLGPVGGAPLIVVPL